MALLYPLGASKEQPAPVDRSLAAERENALPSNRAGGLVGSLLFSCRKVLIGADLGKNFRFRITRY